MTTDRRAEIGELLRQINRMAHEQFRQAFRDFPLPPMTLILLKHIDLEPGVTVSELARRSGTVKSHVSKLIDQLVRQGYLEKRPDPADQRLLRLYTTQSAADMVHEMESRWLGVWSEALAGVPEPELADVVRGLRVLRGALEESSKREPED